MVVYNYKPSNQVNYFSRSVPGGSPTSAFADPVRTHLTPETLLFESRWESELVINGQIEIGFRFESGNLEKAVKITDSYYELYLRPDFYTTRHCQWFYFQVSG